ncbi:HDIG domain-containing protein, partial [Patescibacteria group bacterium]|nr:HDIG domain-containing protein [Patescibacteria group bacterium]
KEYTSFLHEQWEESEQLVEESLRENAPKFAKTTIVNTIQRLCSPTSVESKVVLIKVPQDKIKGKVVGKNGNNIKKLEELIDVDVIFNDLPQTISLSSYNLVNRKIAEIAIEKLIRVKDEINEQVVEKLVEQARKETDEELYVVGKKALKKMEITFEKEDRDLVKTIGRLQYRTSYGQNIMKHSMEVSWAATIIASELGANVQVCRIAGFLHDLGKAIDQDPDVQGAHDFLTKELMEKYGFNEAEIHAAWTHHESEPPKTPEALIVMAADAISAGRPGARQESIDRYIERIQALEGTAMSFDGVKKSFAISAGREVRVLVDPEEVKDEQIKEFATKIAKKIEHDLSYPGKIKINVIRKTRHTEIAK